MTGKAERRDEETDRVGNRNMVSTEKARKWRREWKERRDGRAERERTWGEKCRK